MNEPPRLNEWRITSRIGMNRKVKTIVAQIAITILAPSRCGRLALGAVSWAAVMPRPGCRCDGGAEACTDTENEHRADAENDQHRADHHHRHRRAERPVLADVELAVDH